MPRDSRPDNAHERLQEQIRRKERRKLRARQEGDRGVWFGLGMMGLVGWSIAVPTVIGVMLGLYIDSRTDAQVSWTLMLLFLGIVVGCLNAWYWVKRESEPLARAREDGSETDTKPSVRGPQP